MKTFLRQQAPRIQNFLGATPRHAPSLPLLILGQAPLMGAITGFLAVELGPDGGTQGSRLWTLYELEIGYFPWLQTQETKKIPYARLCTDAPRGAPDLPALTYWVNPLDPLTQSAGFGAEWLHQVSATPRNGLVQARLNTLMLDAQATTVLTGLHSRSQ